VRRTTGSVSSTLTSSGWSAAGIAIAGTTATPSPASTSPSAVVTCCASKMLRGRSRRLASAWSSSTRLPEDWLIEMKS